MIPLLLGRSCPGKVPYVGKNAYFCTLKLQTPPNLSQGFPAGTVADVMRKGNRYWYILAVYATGIVIFTLFRVVNTLVYCMGAETWPDFEGQYPYALLMGWRFDTVVSCYLLTIPLLLAIIGEIARIRARGYYLTMHILTVVLYTVAFFACSVDVPFFSYFFTRLNAVSVNEVDSFGLIADMILSEPVYLLGLAAFIGLAVGYAFLMRWVYRRLLRDASAFLPVGWAAAVAALLLFVGFWGMRGRLSQKSPIRVGTAYYCGDAFLNQLGLNPLFTFVKSMEEMSKSANQPLTLMSPDEAWAVYEADHATPVDSALAATAIALPEGMNVVVVLMESMSVDKTGLLQPERSLTPNLDSLMRNGLVFTQCYSAGIHTYNGIYSALYAHPAVLARHTMKHTFIPLMCGLPHQLKAQNYQTAYMMTHDEDYDNMRGFLLANDFDSVLGQHHFPADESIGTWGLPDHRLLDHAIEHCNAVAGNGKPFLTTIMTCSDHAPYSIPDGIDFSARSKEMAGKIVEYADWSIGRFMQMAAQQEWFGNTLFVFIADHGAAGQSIYDISLPYHHVPMLFYCPAHIAPQRCDRLALQLDLYPTLMGMMPYAYDNNTFGLDLLRQRRQLAYFSSDTKIGVLDTAWLYICHVAENNEHLYHWCDTTAGDQIALHRDKADTMRRYAFGLVQHSYNMLESHTTNCSTPLTH